MQQQGRIRKTVSLHRREPVAYLAKRRFWFDDSDPAGDPPANDSNGAIDLSGLSSEIRAYIEERDRRIKELNNESASRRHEIERLKQEREAEQKTLMEKLAAEGNFKAIADETAKKLAEAQAKAARLDNVEAIIRTNNEAQIALVPEHMRSLIPSNLAPEALAEYLAKNMAILTRQPAPNLDPGVNGGSGNAPKLTAEEKIIAKKMKMTEAEYLEQKQKIAGKTPS